MREKIVSYVCAEFTSIYFTLKTRTDYMSKFTNLFEEYSMNKEIRTSMLLVVVDKKILLSCFSDVWSVIELPNRNISINMHRFR